MTTLTLTYFCRSCAPAESWAQVEPEVHAARIECSGCSEVIEGIKYAEQPEQRAGVHQNPPCPEHQWAHPFNECPTLHHNDGESLRTSCGVVWSGQVEASGDIDDVNCRTCLLELRRMQAEADLIEAGYGDLVTTSEVDGLEPAGEQLAIEARENRVPMERLAEAAPAKWLGYSRLEQLTKGAQSQKSSAHSGAKLAEVDYLTELINQAELMRARAIDQARNAGDSWSAIGSALGVSKQAAAQKYGKKP